VRFQNGCKKVAIELWVVQFWSEIILVISNHAARMISDQIALQSVRLPLFILDNQLENTKTAKVFCPVSLKWDLDIGKILFTSSFIKHEQFDFSLLVNGKSIERKVFPAIL